MVVFKRKCATLRCPQFPLPLACDSCQIAVHAKGGCYGYIVYGYKELHPLGLALFP